MSFFKVFGILNFFVFKKIEFFLQKSKPKIIEDTSKYYNPKTPKGYIHSRSVEHVMKAWSAFDACDRDSSNTINSVEFKFLLYCYEGDIPSYWRV